MKISNLSSLLLSFLAIGMITVFMSSCAEKEVITNLEQVEEEITYYAFSDEVMKLSDQELSEYFQSLSPTELEGLETKLPDTNIESRGCNSPKRVGQGCSYRKENDCSGVTNTRWFEMWSQKCSWGYYTWVKWFSCC